MAPCIKEGLTSKYLLNSAMFRCAALLLLTQAAALGKLDKLRFMCNVHLGVTDAATMTKYLLQTFFASAVSPLPSATVLSLSTAAFALSRSWEVPVASMVSTWVLV